MITDLVNRLQTKGLCLTVVKRCRRQDPAVNQSRQVVGKHLQHFVNTVEVEQTRIIKASQSVKNTVQRKNPIIQDEVKR